MTISRRTLALTTLLSVLLLLNIWATYSIFTAPYPGHNDFMSRWEGARAYWQQGLNPYGPQASLQIQEAIYGRAAQPNEDPGYFAYPFYTIFPLWPLVQVSYSWASAVWMVLLEAGLILALILLIRHVQWRPAPLVLGALILLTLIGYYPARGLLLGQPGLLVYVLQIAAVWGLGQRRDGLAGAVLALSTIKPQMGYLIVPFLLLWGLSTQRWRFVGSFALTFGGLMGLSFVLQPSWFGDWLAQLSLYTGYTELGSPVWIVAHYPWLGLLETGKWGIVGGFGSVIEAALTVALYGLMLWAWFTVLIQKRHERWLWVVALTLTVTHLVAPRTATPHYVVFMLPLVVWLKQLTARRGRVVWALLLVVALLVLPWLHFLGTVVNKFEHPAVYVPIPFLALAGLWVTRREWWDQSLGRI